MSDHDLALLGATGFTGRLTAEHLARTAPPGARIALAGRSPERLRAVRDGLGEAAAGWTLITADSSEPASAAELAATARVVVTTAGPYRHRGLPLVEACATRGTHYADLAGEVLFMRETIDRAHDAAAESGARIVHCCGWDSVPSDIGVLLLHRHAQEQGLGDLLETTLVIEQVRGGVSGGSIQSLREQIDEARASPRARVLLSDPYALSPDRDAEPDIGPEPDPGGAVRDPALGGYLAPLSVGLANPRIVRRSNALLGHAYGRALRYRELMLCGPASVGLLKAHGVSTARRAYLAALPHRPIRRVLDRLLPAPGEGPAPERRERGLFRLAIHTRTSAGARLACRVHGPGDPGYAATAVMLGESALALAFDEPLLTPAAGVLTPATGLGPRLADRLRAAGHTYVVAAA